jgi:hypothetical protein
MRREGHGRCRRPTEQLLQLSSGAWGGRPSVRAQRGGGEWRRAHGDGEEERFRVWDAHLKVIICYMNLKQWKFQHHTNIQRYIGFPPASNTADLCGLGDGDVCGGRPQKNDGDVGRPTRKGKGKVRRLGLACGSMFYIYSVDLNCEPCHE